MKICCKNMRLFPSAAGAILLVSASPAWSKDYFDPGLLTLSGGQVADIDLSQFETSGQIPAGTYPVTVWVNQADQGQQSVVFKNDAHGQIQPELTPALLHHLGVNTRVLPGFIGLPTDIPVKNLTELIPDAQVRFDFPQLRLELSIPQVAMQPNVQGYVDPALWDKGIPAFLMNYSLSGGRNWQEGQAGTSKSEQTNLFANLRGGFNWEDWRLRSDMTHTRNQSSSNNQPRQSFQKTQFMNTYLQRDIQAWRSEILAGDSSTSNEVFDSIPFRGVKLNSTEEMRPNSLRGFAPLISGIAQSNARVTVSQNGHVVYQTYVAPGPFRLNDLYQTGQGGDLTVTITEADGSVRTQSVPFSSLPMMQRPGGFKYELTSGRYNGGVTRGSQQANFGLATLIYGLPYNITLYGGGLVAEDYHSLVVGTGISLGAVGAISADVTTSNAKFAAQNERQQGNSYRIRYAKSLLTTGTSVDLAAYRYSTRNYYSFADFNNQGFQLSDGQVPWALERQRSNFQLQISQQLGSFGSLYLSASRNDYWGNNQVNNNLSAGYNGSYHGVSYGLAYSIDRIEGDGSWPENRQLSLNIQLPFSLFSSSALASRSYASYQMTHNNQGQVRQQAGLNGNALDDHLSYSVMQGFSNSDSSDGGNLNLGYQGSKGMANMGYSYSSQSRSLNMNGNGGVVVHPQGVTLSQMLGNSVALVSAPGAGGVHMMNGNVETDSRGYAVVPYLSNYQKNDISLNPSTLPDDVDITQSSLNVYPTKGAVVMASFATHIGYQALVTLNKGTTPVPFGALVTVEGAPSGEVNTGIVGDNGQVYLTGLPEQGRLTTQWGKGADQQCQVTFNLQDIPAPSANNPIRTLTAHCEVNP